MFARRLGRTAGLVFVLAVVFGGVGATSVDKGESLAAAKANAVVEVQTLSIDWD